MRSRATSSGAGRCPLPTTTMYTAYAVTGFSSASGRPWRTKLRTRPPGAVAKRLHLLFEQRADPDDLAPRDPQPKRLDELVDTPRRDAAHIGLLHDRHQRLLRAPARLQERRKVAALPELGVCNSISPALVSHRLGQEPLRHVARSSLRSPSPAPISSETSPLHQLPAEHANGSRTTSACPSSRTPRPTPQTSSSPHRPPLVPPTRRTVERPTIMSAAVAGPTIRPTRTSTTLWDVTPGAAAPFLHARAPPCKAGGSQASLEDTQKPAPGRATLLLCDRGATARRRVRRVAGGRRRLASIHRGVAVVPSGCERRMTS